MKEKFSITPLMDLLPDGGLDYPSERVRCRRIHAPRSAVYWEQVDREQVGYGGMRRKGWTWPLLLYLLA